MLPEGATEPRSEDGPGDKGAGQTAKREEDGSGAGGSAASRGGVLVAAPLHPTPHTLHVSSSHTSLFSSVARPVPTSARPPSLRDGRSAHRPRLASCVLVSAPGHRPEGLFLTTPAKWVPFLGGDGRIWNDLCARMLSSVAAGRLGSWRAGRGRGENGTCSSSALLRGLGLATALP